MQKEDRDGGGVIDTTGPSTDDDGVINNGTAFPFNPVAREAFYIFAVELSSVTQHEFEGGFFQNSNNYILFTSDDNNNIFVRCKSGGIETAVDSGQAQDTSLRYYKIVVLPNGSVNFYEASSGWADADFSLITNINTNVPTGQHQTRLYHKTTENVVKSMSATFQWAQQKLS